MFNFSCWVALAILLIHELVSCIMNHLVTRSWEFLLVPWKPLFVFWFLFFLNSVCTLWCFPNNSQSIFYFYSEDLLHYMDQSMPMCSITNQILGKSRAIKWFSLVFLYFSRSFPLSVHFSHLILGWCSYHMITQTLVKFAPSSPQ